MQCKLSVSHPTQLHAVYAVAEALSHPFKTQTLPLHTTHAHSHIHTPVGVLMLTPLPASASANMDAAAGCCCSRAMSRAVLPAWLIAVQETAVYEHSGT